NGLGTTDVHLPLALALSVGGVDDGVNAAQRLRDAGRLAHVDSDPFGLTSRRALEPGRAHVPSLLRRSRDQLAPEVPAASGDEEPLLRYQPRRSSSSLGSSDCVEMPTIASPRPVETRAITSASK